MDKMFVVASLMPYSESEVLIPTSINHVLFTVKFMFGLHGLLWDFLVDPLHLLDEFVLLARWLGNKFTSTPNTVEKNANQIVATRVSQIKLVGGFPNQILVVYFCILRTNYQQNLVPNMQKLYLVSSSPGPDHTLLSQTSTWPVVWLTNPSTDQSTPVGPWLHLRMLVSLCAEGVCQPHLEKVALVARWEWRFQEHIQTHQPPGPYH